MEDKSNRIKDLLLFDYSPILQSHDVLDMISLLASLAFTYVSVYDRFAGDNIGGSVTVHYTKI